MSGGGKSGTTTQQVTIPPDVLARYNSVNARAENVAQQGFQQYGNTPDAFVAPLNPTQTAGIANTNAAATGSQPYFGAATGLTMSGIQDVGPLTQGQIGYYQNPFTQSVVNPTLQALRQQQGQDQNALLGKQAMSGAFGGDRAGLERANLYRQQELGTAQAIAPLYQQGYQQAVTTAAGQQGVQAADLARRMQGGQQIAGIGQAVQGAGLQGAQAQLAAGQTQQQTEQAGKQALYNQFLQQQGYPFQVAQFLANIAMGTGSLSGSTTTTEAPTGFFSDERDKTNVDYLGKGQYAYDYKSDVDRAEKDGTPMPPKRVGPMAQDIEKEQPGLVADINGHKVVRGPDSEGGAVIPERAGLGFAIGGSAGFDQDMIKQIMANQAGMYSGMYGQEGAPRGLKGTPGVGGGRVPTANLPVGKIATAGSVPQQQSSGLSQAAQTGQNISNLLQMGSKAKEALTSNPSKPSLPDRTIGEGDARHVVNPGEATGYAKETVVGGKIDGEEAERMISARGGRIHKLYGGPADIASPQGLYSPIGSGIDIPDEKNKYELKTAANAGKIDPNPGIKDLSSAVTTAKNTYGTYKMADKAKNFIAGLGEKDAAATTEGLGAGTPGVEAAKDVPLPPARPEGLGAGATDTAAAGTPAAEGLAGGTEAATAEAAATAAAEEAATTAATEAATTAAAEAAATTAAEVAAAAAAEEAAAAAAMILLVKRGGRTNSPTRKHFKAGGLGLADIVDPEAVKASDPGLGALVRGEDVPVEEKPKALQLAEVKPTGLSDETRAPPPTANFGTSLSRVFKEEGGLNERDTNGQPSLYGINAKYHPDFFKNPTREAAAKIYKSDYWDAIGADQMPAPLAHVAFDTAVIAGPKKAKDLIAASGGDPAKLLALRQDFQNSLIEANPGKYGDYRKTWNNRIANLSDDIAKMSEGKDINLGGARRATAPPSAGETAPVRVTTGTSVATPGLGGAGQGNLDAYAAPFRNTIGKLVGDNEALKSENFWVPMLAGIGSMLASNRITLGGAIGEGLVGGTAAYTGLQKQQADIGRIKADTEKVFTDMVDSSFKTVNGVTYIRYRKPDGTFDWMMYGDYLGMPVKPPVDPRYESVVNQLSKYGVTPGTPGAAQAVVNAGEANRGGAGTPVAGGTTTGAVTAKPATGAATTSAVEPVKPATGAAEPAKPAVVSTVPTAVGLSPELIAQAKDATKRYTYAGEVERTAAKDPKNDYFNMQQGRATGAQSQMQQIVPLMGAFASLPKDKSIAASGRLQEFAQPIIGTLSNLAAMAGRPDLVINPEILTSQNEVEKLVNQLQQSRLDASQLRAVEAFKAMAQGVPSLMTSPGGQGALMAQLMTNARREIDKDKFFADWKKAGVGDNMGMTDFAALTGREANRAFDNTFKEEFYARDRKSIENTFKDVIKEIKSPTTGQPITVAEYLARSGAKITPDQKKAITAKYGPNILGYYGISE